MLLISKSQVYERYSKISSIEALLKVVKNGRHFSSYSFDKRPQYMCELSSDDPHKNC